MAVGGRMGGEENRGRVVARYSLSTLGSRGCGRGACEPPDRRGATD